MKISNESKVGVIAAISITILILGYNFMKGENLFTSYNRYYATYDDVEGLFKSNPVMINGYKVGQVSNVEMNNQSLRLVVEVKVPDHIKVPADAVVKIVNTDLIGSKGIQIIMGNSHVYAKPGDTLTSDKDQGMAKALSKLIAPLSEKINVLLSEVNSQIGGDQIKTTLKNLNQTLVTAEGAIKTLETVVEGKSNQLDGILNNLNGVSADLKSATPMVKSVMSNLNETTEELKRMELEKTIKDLRTAITDISKTIEGINSGKGTLGQLATNEDLYKKLNATIETINHLAADIENYPSRYTGITKGQRKRAEKQKKQAGQ